MNFFGHAVVAGWSGAEAGLAAGSMLPDFTVMLRAEPPQVLDRAVERGVELHHLTDAVFHRCRVFKQLERGAHRALSSRGVRRGTARASAHVGVELLIDRALALQEPDSTAAFHATLDWLKGPAGREGVRWRAAHHPSAGQLVQRLRRLALAELDAASVLTRLRAAFRRRPRLAVLAQDEAALRDWLASALGEVEARTPELVGELRAGLRDRGAAWAAG